MGIFRVKVVARAVEIGGHYRAVIGAVLAIVALAELDASDLGHGIGLVGGLEHAGQERVLAHGLGHSSGIDAARVQLQQPPHARVKGLVDYIALDHQVFVNEISWISVVGMDAADLGGGKNNHIGPLGLHEIAHRQLAGQV